jgi:hypothetical protein
MHQEKSLFHSTASFKPKTGGLPTQKYREAQMKYAISAQNKA